MGILKQLLIIFSLLLLVSCGDKATTSSSDSSASSSSSSPSVPAVPLVPTASTSSAVDLPTRVDPSADMDVDGDADSVHMQADTEQTDQMLLGSFTSFG